MLRLVDVDPYPETEEVLLAGMKRLPIGRMMKQAGREVNDFYTRGQYGTVRRDAEGNIMRDRDGLPLRREIRTDRRKFPKQDGDGKMPSDLKERFEQRMKKTYDAIDNFDPAEAQWKEDYNKKLKNKPDSPIDPLSVPELIQPIAPLDQNQYPYEPMGMPGV